MDPSTDLENSRVSPLAAIHDVTFDTPPLSWCHEATSLLDVETLASPEGRSPLAPSSLASASARALLLADAVECVAVMLPARRSRPLVARLGIPPLAQRVCGMKICAWLYPELGASLGTKRTSHLYRRMSAIGGKADMVAELSVCPLMTQSGQFAARYAYPRS